MPSDDTMEEMNQLKEKIEEEKLRDKSFKVCCEILPFLIFPPRFTSRYSLCVLINHKIFMNQNN